MLKHAIGFLLAVVLAAAVLPANSVRGSEDVPPALDRESGLLLEARRVRREINLHNLYNGLHLSAEQVESVPASLRDACKLAASSSALREIFTPAFIDNLVRIADFEAAACDKRVTDVERRRYLEMV